MDRCSWPGCSSAVETARAPAEVCVPGERGDQLPTASRAESEGESEADPAQVIKKALVARQHDHEGQATQGPHRPHNDQVTAPQWTSGDSGPKRSPDSAYTKP